MENNDVVIFRPDEIQLERHFSKIGVESDSMILYKDPESEMMVKYIRYPKGCVARDHVHSCGHGVYILKGTMITNVGEFPPGSFVWFKEGVVMSHGAVDEDVDCIFVSNKPFDIDYLELRK